MWPCEAADLESRIHVLMRLAEKTSHRDTLEVLCNLPGLKESNGEEEEGIFIVQTSSVFFLWKSNMALYTLTHVFGYSGFDIVQHSCFLQSWSTSPGSVLCSTLTCKCVWTGRYFLWPPTRWTSCCLKSWQLTMPCCRCFYTNWASRTFGFGQEKSSGVSIYVCSNRDL